MTFTKILLSRPFIKINACLIGYGLWILLSQHQTVTMTCNIPICFFKLQANTKIVAPDTVQIIVSGTKNILQKFDIYNNALHLDASELSQGENRILLQKENLFLPDEINLINLIPSSLSIELKKTE
ncbi:MAG: hypothetical protein ACXWL5_02095 [Candidatus Chromulinivorax sp.]